MCASVHKSALLLTKMGSSLGLYSRTGFRRHYWWRHSGCRLGVDGKIL